ncbi:MAG: hypothetical protein QGG38_03200 [Nitrospinaceae bacterium]|nr:hypothetical protein [Nitrospinaceae bacterium]MDP6711679.1 hypothetical protein [Nitrospinaceae bacterium]
MSSGLNYRWGNLSRWSLHSGFTLLHYLMTVMVLSCLIFCEILFRHDGWIFDPSAWDLFVS